MRNRLKRNCFERRCRERGGSQDFEKQLIEIEHLTLVQNFSCFVCFERLFVGLLCREKFGKRLVKRKKKEKRVIFVFSFLWLFAERGFLMKILFVVATTEKERNEKLGELRGNLVGSFFVVVFGGREVKHIFEKDVKLFFIKALTGQGHLVSCVADVLWSEIRGVWCLLQESKT